MYLQNNLRGVKHVGIPTVDIDASIRWYVNTLDYRQTGETRIPTPDGDVRIAFVERDGLVLEFYQLLGADLEETRSRTHGHIDHITMDVLDLPGALHTAQQRGAQIDTSISSTPVNAPMYHGVSYIFLLGPNGERIELNQRHDLNPARRDYNLGGWAHMGIPVVDIQKSIGFYQGFGFEIDMQCDIPTEEGVIQIAIVKKDHFCLEFYQLVGAELEQVRRRGDGHIDHVALNVDDVQQAYAELRAADFEVLSDGPVDLPVGEYGMGYFFIRGPVGEKIELNQTYHPADA